MALSTLDAMVQRTETAIARQVRIAQRQQRLAKLMAELRKRPWIALRPLAEEIGLTNPHRIYKILDGTLPTPEDFVEDVCTWTGIPLKAVLPEDEYRALHEYLEQDAYEENLQRMGNGY